MRRPLAHLLLAFALLWHLLSVLADGWATGVEEHHGRDFASYYYAVQVAADGGNPYDKTALAEYAAADGTRKGVFPYFYPPPFLLGMVWALPMSLVGAYRLWFWLDELALWAAMLALWRWWRPLGAEAGGSGGTVDVGVVIAVLVAVLTAVSNNHLMGQANLFVLALVIGGLWAEDAGRPVVGGALVGVACMMKMSPALFVAWWLLHRRWTPAVVACVAAVVLTLLSLPLCGPSVQADFYLRVLPGFGSGDYNGLPIPVALFGNHSIPDIWNAMFPARGAHLSSVARALSTLSAVGVVAGLGFAFFRPPADALARAGQVSAIAVAMLLVPVYTYEHHVVWAIPAAVIAVVAVLHGRIDERWAVAVGLAVAAWAFDLAKLKDLFTWLDAHRGPWAFVVEELKFAALLVFFAAAVAAGRSAGPARMPSGGSDVG